MKSSFFSLILCLISICAYSGVEYKATLIGTEAIPGASWGLNGITNKGQLFGHYSDSQKQTAFIYEAKGGFVFIEKEKHSFSNHLIANNNGQVVGSWSGSPGNFIWSKALGVRPLDIFGARITPHDFNDLGQLIGTYYDYSKHRERSFLWDNGVLTDMGPGSEFAKDIEVLGYQVMDIKLTAINNKGEMAGYFQYGKYNEKQKKLVPVSQTLFFWNGMAHICPLPPIEFSPEVVKLNNNGFVMVSERKFDLEAQRERQTTYLWDLENGLQAIHNFEGIDINDSATILGNAFDYSAICPDCELRRKPAIWKKGNYATLAELLGVKKLDSLAPPFSDTFDVERIRDPIAINNKGQVACLGYVWGEWQPCILEPIKESL